MTEPLIKLPSVIFDKLQAKIAEQKTKIAKQPPGISSSRAANSSTRDIASLLCSPFSFFVKKYHDLFVRSIALFHCFKQRFLFPTHLSPTLTMAPVPSTIVSVPAAFS